VVMLAVYTSMIVFHHIVPHVTTLVGRISQTAITPTRALLASEFTECFEGDQGMLVGTLQNKFRGSADKVDEALLDLLFLRTHADLSCALRTDDD
jgi:hypothetical protein